MEDIFAPDYIHAKRIWGYFEIKILGEYHSSKPYIVVS